MAFDARKGEFEEAKLFGRPVLFTESVVSQFTVPRGWFCYAVSGKSGDPVEPETIEKYAALNRVGTLLTPAKIPFGRGKTSIDARINLEFLGELTTLEEFCTSHGLRYPADNRKFIPRPASRSEAGLFYAHKQEMDELLGSIGHLRMDFGRRGGEFWTTWHDHCGNKLNTPEFKAEIDEVVNELRQTVLKDRSTMRSFCADFGGELGENYGIRQYGYIVETEHYRYCLRCKPQEGDYDGYLWCFDKRVQDMNRVQKETEIRSINEEIRPFDIQMHDLGDYYLALRFSFFEDDDAGYGQAAFDAYAADRGEEPVDEHGCHARGSGYDWDEVFKYTFKDTPGFEKLRFNSEAGCFFCDSVDLDLLKNCAVTMKGLCEDREQFTKQVRNALDARYQQVKQKAAEETHTFIKGLLGEVDPKATAAWDHYFEELDQDGTEHAVVLYRDLCGELEYVKEKTDAGIARRLYDMGQEHTLNPFEMRYAALLLMVGESEKEVQKMSVEDDLFSVMRREYGSFPNPLPQLEKTSSVGRTCYASGETQEHEDALDYIKTVREELPYRATSGFQYETLTNDPIVRKAVDDILYNEFGEKIF